MKGLKIIAALAVVLILMSPVYGATYGKEKTLDSIDRLRIAEDAIWLFASLFIVLIAFRLRHLVEGMETSSTLFLLTFLAIFVWKLFGVWRRVWAPAFSGTLHDVGELLEGISGLLIGISFLYTYLKLK